MGSGDSKDNVSGSQDTADRLRNLAERCKAQEECWNMVENEGLLNELVNIVTRSSLSSDDLDVVLDLLTHIAKNCIIDFNEPTMMLENHYSIFHKKMEEAGGYTGLGKLLLSCGESTEKKKEREKVAVAFACCSLFRNKMEGSTVAEPLVSTLFASLQDCKMDETLRIYNLLCASFSCLTIKETHKAFTNIAGDIMEIAAGKRIDNITCLCMKFLNHTDFLILTMTVHIIVAVYSVKYMKPTLDTFVELILTNTTNILTCGKSLKPLSVSEPVSVPVPTPLSSPLCYVSATTRDTRLSPLCMCAHFLSCLNGVLSVLDPTLLPGLAAAVAGKIGDVLLISFELFDTLHDQIHVGDVHERVEGDVVILTNYSRKRVDMYAAGLLTMRTLTFIAQLMALHPPAVPMFTDIVSIIVPMVIRQEKIAITQAVFVLMSKGKEMSEDEVATKALETYATWTEEDSEGQLKRVYLQNVMDAARYLFTVSKHGSKNPDPATGRNSVRASVDACGGVDVFRVINNWLLKVSAGCADKAVVQPVGVSLFTSALAVCLLHRGAWPPTPVFEEQIEILRIAKDRNDEFKWVWDEMKHDEQSK